MTESVERFREERVLEKFWEAEGRSSEDTEVGKEGSTAIALCTSEIYHVQCQESTMFEITLDPLNISAREKALANFASCNAR